jgi:hypothetical protein
MQGGGSPLLYYVKLSGNSQRYVTKCCESESDGIIDGFGATKAYSQTDIDVRSYQRPQKGQITSTMVEYLQGIQTAKEAAD